MIISPKIPSIEPEKCEVLVSESIYQVIRDSEATINYRKRSVEAISFHGDFHTGKAYAIIIYQDNNNNK